MNQQKFIVAVSGGVDSMVLLHMLVSRKSDRVSYVVAHFDHGIRDDSHLDYALVENLAKKYELPFEGKKAKLGSNTSEAEARNARYSFLREIKSKHRADKIITAHHQDDLLETMVINILRGTSPRGLAPMQGQNDLLRPLINKTKSQLIEYAEKYNLLWNEDSSNTNEKFLRNYIRLNIMPRLDSHKHELLEINSKVQKLYHDIDLRVENLLYGQKLIYRPRFVYYPYLVQKEITRAWLVKSGVEDISSSLIERTVVAIKTMPIGKKIDLDKNHWLISQKQNLAITSK